MDDVPKDRRRERKIVKGLELREMELDDLPLVYSLGEKLFTAERWPSLYRTWDEYEMLDIFTSDGEFCLVAELDGKIVGFALGSLIEKRRSAWTYGWLIWFGVEQELKGCGIGTRLLNQLTQQFIEHGARMMIVDTDIDNLEALDFFDKHGFGDRIGHVYLSKNLTSHPAYLRRRGKKKTPSTAAPRCKKAPVPRSGKIVR
ncbi:MAG TPA: GNAT family N-acetyltransferase [Thermodesulfobacteriota bacterium]|nr:GNAT family N-acetyltransferase [Deltaproteobacteria bacterium]HNU71567.1 GNAT family N-acetyltransferase [Thermodesulfobacteriota bacterium]HOC37671.1 GNAT family N-acetyltransferase [Thermodesulfobacteriota bacterium]